MGYRMVNGRWANTEDTTLAASAARTATGTGTAVELGDRTVGRLLLNVTAASGTGPTLDVTIECSADGVTWYTSGTFAQKTAAGTERKLFMLDRFVRARWTIAGTTPSFAFSIAGEAV